MPPAFTQSAPQTPALAWSSYNHHRGLRNTLQHTVNYKVLLCSLQQEAGLVFVLSAAVVAEVQCLGIIILHTQLWVQGWTA